MKKIVDILNCFNFVQKKEIVERFNRAYFEAFIFTESVSFKDVSAIIYKKE